MRGNAPTFLFLVAKKSLSVRSTRWLAPEVFPTAYRCSASAVPKPPTENRKPPTEIPVAGFGFSVAGFGSSIGGFGFPVGGFGSLIGGFGGRAVSAGGTAVRMNRAERFKKQTLQPVRS